MQNNQMVTPEQPCAFAVFAILKSTKMLNQTGTSGHLKFNFLISL